MSVTNDIKRRAFYSDQRDLFYFNKIFPFSPANVCFNRRRVDVRRQIIFRVRHGRIDEPILKYGRCEPDVFR